MSCNLALEERTFMHFLEENALAVPPIPKEAYKNLEEFYPNLFSTEARSINTSFSTLDLNNLDFLFPVSSDSSKNINYFACGLYGRNAQNLQFCYLLDAKELQLAIAIPSPDCFSNSNYDKSKLEVAYMLLEACSQYALKNKQVRLILNARQCAWEILDEDGNVLHTGNNEHLFIRALIQYSKENCPKTSDEWIRI